MGLRRGASESLGRPALISPATSRLERSLSTHGRTRLVPFLTAGFPTLQATAAMAAGLAAHGAAALEIGVPFSDPIADGPDIQRASEWALRRRVGMGEVLGLVRDIRARAPVPIVLMTYANPVLRYGAARFAHDARAAGADGVLMSDLPPEELPDVWGAMDTEGLDTVVLVAPTTDASRLPALIARARGFVYCLTRTGVTGGSAGEHGDLAARVAAVRQLTPLPVGVGFGIATPAQAAALSGVADAAVVGAALMRAAGGPEAGAVERVVELGASLAQALEDAAARGSGHGRPPGL